MLATGLIFLGGGGEREREGKGISILAEKPNEPFHLEHDNAGSMSELSYCSQECRCSVSFSEFEVKWHWVLAGAWTVLPGRGAVHHTRIIKFVLLPTVQY